MKVFLDDIRYPERGEWDYIARTGEEAIKLLETSEVTKISLDHDLGLDRISGYDVAKWIEQRVFNDETYNCPDITVHSKNPVGRRNIFACIGAINRHLYNKSIEK